MQTALGNYYTSRYFDVPSQVDLTALLGSEEKVTAHLNLKKSIDGLSSSTTLQDQILKCFEKNIFYLLGMKKRQKRD